MTVALSTATVPVDANFANYQDGYVYQILNGAVLTVTDATPNFTVPFMTAAGKVKLVIEVTAASGTTPTLVVAYQETVDGTNYNTAALTSGSLTTTGTTWTSAASGPVFNTGKLTVTLGGTTPSFTVNAYLVVWNK